MYVKSLFSGLIVILSYSTGYCQGDQKIATTLHLSKYTYYPGLRKDSTAFYYDKNGELRSAVEYVLPEHSDKWRPRSLKVYPTTQTGIEEQIIYDYDTSAGDWLKNSKKIHTTSTDGRTITDELFSWNQVDGEFERCSFAQIEKWYSGKKLTEVLQARCSNCRGNNTDVSQLKQSYFYDANDSIAAVEERIMPAGDLISKVLYEYTWEDGLLVRVQRDFGHGVTEYSKTINRYILGKLVSSRYYLGADQKSRCLNFDSFAYEGNNQSYIEHNTYEYDGSIRSSYRKNISYSAEGLVLKWVQEIRNNQDSTWIMSAMIDNTYGRDGKLMDTKYYVWNQGSASWDFSFSIYNKYDAKGAVFEAGHFNGVDSTWDTMHYYATPSKTYKPADSTLTVLLSPNPIGNSIHAYIYSTEYYPVTFTLFDALGRRIVSQSFEVAPGPNSIDIISRESLRPGCYPYYVQAGTNAPVTGKLMVVE